MKIFRTQMLVRTDEEIKNENGEAEIVEMNHYTECFIPYKNIVYSRKRVDREVETWIITLIDESEIITLHNPFEEQAV